MVRVKDKTPDLKKCGAVYQLDCPQCDQSYIGETERTLGTRLKEHLRHSDNPTAVREHMNKTGHSVTDQDVKVIGREDQWLKRKITEAVAIRKHHPSLNRDEGYKLARVYDRLLSRDRSGHVT